MRYLHSSVIWIFKNLFQIGILWRLYQICYSGVTTRKTAKTRVGFEAELDKRIESLFREFNKREGYLKKKLKLKSVGDGYYRIQTIVIWQQRLFNILVSCGLDFFETIKLIRLKNCDINRKREKEEERKI